MRESQVEAYLVRLVKELGGLAVKLGVWGWPDRIILLPGGRIGFLELKRPGEVPRELQTRRLASLVKLGFMAEWASTPQEVSTFLERLCGIPSSYETTKNKCGASPCSASDARSGLTLA